MATPFSEIREYIAACFATGMLSTLASDSRYETMLNSQIRFRNLALGYPSQGEEFDPDLTPNQILILTYRCALGIATTMPDEFSYKTPVTSVTRKAMKRDLLPYLQEELQKAENGTGSLFAMEVQTAYEAAVTMPERIHLAISQAFNAYPNLA